MKLIIELKDETYKFLKEKIPVIIARSGGKILTSEVYEAIKNGTPYNPSGNCISDTNKWDKTSYEQEESEQPNDETINNVCDFNDGIADPTYINGIVDCSDFGIYPWGNS